MAFIANKEKNFRKYLENHFGIILPSGVEIFYTKGVRIGNSFIRKSTIHGDLGYAACDFGFNPTNALIQNFGHLAKKNVVDVDKETAKHFAAGRSFGIELHGKSRYVLVRFRRHSLGLGYFDNQKRKIMNKLPDKREREIVNTIEQF
jgi:hypothetical protein